MQKYFNVVILSVLLTHCALFSMEEESKKEEERIWELNAKLHGAAANGNLDLIEALVERKANINCTRAELAEHRWYIGGGPGMGWQVGGRLDPKAPGTNFAPINEAGSCGKRKAVKLLERLGAKRN